MNSEDEIRRSLERIDRSSALADDAAQRVEARMLARFDQLTAGDARPDSAEIVPLIDPAFDGGSPNKDRSGAVWWARAAAILAISAAAIVATRWIGDSDQNMVGPSDTSDAPIAPSEPSELPELSVGDGVNAFGYRVFTTYNYLASDERIASEVPPALSDRVGAVAVNGTTPTMTVRRAIADASPEPFELEIEEDGNVVVPLEWLDPTSIGGRCTGGATIVGLSMPESAIVSAICDGSPTSVIVEATPGEAQELERGDATTVTATPLRITITPDARVRDARSVTLWFSDDGLVRRTQTIDDASVDYDLDASSIDVLGPT